MVQPRNGSRQFTLEVLRDLLRKVDEDRGSATLHVSDGFSERIFHFADGWVQCLSLGERSGPDVPGHLLERGRIEWDALEVLRKEARRQDRTLLDLLLAERILSKDEAEALSRKLIRDELLDLVFWEDATFRISDTPPPAEVIRLHQPLLRSRLGYGQLSGDLAAWIKAWSLHKLTLHGDTSRLSLKEAGLDALARETGPTGTILAAARGGVRFRKLWRSLELDLAETCQRLGQLVEMGWISVTPAAQMSVVGTPERAIQVLEETLQRAIGKDLVRERLVYFYQRAKRPLEACEHLQVLADQMARRGDWEGATERHREILAIRPEDIGTLQKALKLLQTQGATDRARSLAFEVSQALFRQKKAAELRVVAGLLDGLPDALHLTQEVRADLSSLSGAVERCTAEYVTAANRHEEAGDFERARCSIAKALLCAPDNQGLKARHAALKRPADSSKQVAMAAALAAGSSSWREPRRRAFDQPLMRLVVGACAVAAGAIVAFTGILPFGSRSSAEAEVDEAISRTAAAAGAGASGKATGPRASRAASGSTAPRNARTGQEAAPPADSSVLEPTREELLRLFDLTQAPSQKRCRRHGTHFPRTIRIDPEHWIRFAVSCDVTLEDPGANRNHGTLEGREGQRWSIDPRADVICAWVPGERAVLHLDPFGAVPGNTPSRKQLEWILPAGTEAVAAGRDSLALRSGSVTRIVDLEGELIASGELFPWEEGFISGGMLAVAGAPEGSRLSRQIRVVSCITLQPLRVITTGRTPELK